ncbi:MAG TPA: ABC transporter ATP-binding protein [Chloroflexota bacterium]|nr:ABC transporter ATP-binding protein [Chloroflexota bacterium]
MNATLIASDPREPSTQAPEPGSVILSVRDLRTSFRTERGVVRAVDGISFDLLSGETFGIVGESGSGKSVTCRSLIGLLPTPPAVTQGTVLYNGRNLVGLSSRQMQMVRGAHISMIFQDPMTFLNPLMRVGDQIAESLQAHTSMGRRERMAAALLLMREVGIPGPERRIRDYPHQFSGGMRQRVLIAIALACRPRILLADEPTTALDVTIQDQILGLLLNLQREFGMTVVLVSHDLGVIAETCDRMAVMYGGQIVEQGDTVTLLTRPKHPYTQGLLRSLPGASTGKYLTPIPGAPPSLIDPPAGCRFLDRCPLAMDQCRTWHTELLPVGPDHLSRCIRHDQMEYAND